MGDMQRGTLSVTMIASAVRNPRSFVTAPQHPNNGRLGEIARRWTLALFHCVYRNDKRYAR